LNSITALRQWRRFPGENSSFNSGFRNERIKIRLFPNLMLNFCKGQLVTEITEENPPRQAWRQAVKKAMRKATRKEALERYGTKKPVFDYRWEHVKAVVPLAVKLAKLMEADVEVVEAAAWLHDVRKGSGNNHPQKGAAFARRFLPETDFPPQKIEAVAAAIADHMGLYLDQPLTSLESQVLWDADKLAKLGITAAMHWLGGDVAKGNRHTTKDLIKDGRSTEWQNKTVESMHTAPARAAAHKRLNAYNRLWDQLEAELRGDDLV
jgi:uncharacterized protein